MLSNTSKMLVKNLSNLLGTRVRLTAVIVNDFVLERETTFAYLVILFHGKLFWVDHIEFMRKKVNQRLVVLRRIKHFLAFYARKLFVNTMVLPF